MRLIPFEIQSDLENNVRHVLSRVGASVIARDFDHSALRAIDAHAARSLVGASGGAGTVDFVNAEGTMAGLIAPPKCRILDTVTRVDYQHETWRSIIVTELVNKVKALGPTQYMTDLVATEASALIDSQAARTATAPLQPLAEARGLAIPTSVSSEQVEGPLASGVSSALARIPTAGHEMATDVAFLHTFSTQCSDGSTWERVPTSPYMGVHDEANQLVMPYFWLRRRWISKRVEGYEAPVKCCDAACAANRAAQEDAAAAKIQASWVKRARAKESAACAAQSDDLAKKLADCKKKLPQPPAVLPGWAAARELLTKQQLVNKKPVDANGKEAFLGAHITPVTLSADCSALTWMTTK